MLHAIQTFLNKKEPEIKPVLPLDIEADDAPEYNSYKDGNPWAKVFGLEDLPLSRLEVVEGELDMEKLSTGKYILEGINCDDNGNLYMKQSQGKLAHDSLLSLLSKPKSPKIPAMMKLIAIPLIFSKPNIVLSARKNVTGNKMIPTPITERVFFASDSRFHTNPSNPTATSVSNPANILLSP